MSTVFTEGNTPGAACVSEANGARSRKVLIAGDNTAFPANSVLGQVTATKAVVAYDPQGADGSETPIGISFGSVDTTAADITSQDCVVFVRDAEFNGEEVEWGAAVTALEKLAATEVLESSIGIVLREASPTQV